MKKVKEYTWAMHRKELMKDPEFRKAFKEVSLEYEIARAIMRARIEKKLTQAKLAKKLHTTQSVVSRVESGRTLPSLTFLKRLAETLDASLHVEFKV